MDRSPSSGGRVVAAFDFDGTITVLDSLRDFVQYTVGNPRFVYGAIRSAPWMARMLIGMSDRGVAKAHFLAATIGAMTRPKLEDAARQFVEHRLSALIRPEMVERIQEHKRHGHQLVLVSASPALYLRAWARGAGFDAVLATELEFRDDRFSGRLASPNCWGAEKVRRLQQWFGNEPPRVLHAYGDSRGDKEMLALADHGWLRGHGEMHSIDE
ncbi:HAD-IB family hydrolase [Paraburkholderia fungorum]|uniref:HAD family hydrolase n=1 Tax=Paraburkholderia fungorum TaxID=134537 RepID=UPI0038BBB022